MSPIRWQVHESLSGSVQGPLEAYGEVASGRYKVGSGAKSC